jgi:hypothetical protein
MHFTPESTLKQMEGRRRGGKHSLDCGFHKIIISCGELKTIFNMGGGMSIGSNRNFLRTFDLNIQLAYTGRDRLSNN